MKSNKGITLVALVITIIVLLILAGVSISLVVGDNGVLTQAKNASSETNTADAKEALERALVGAQAKFASAPENRGTNFIDYLGTNDIIDDDIINMENGYVITVKGTYTASGTGTNGTIVDAEMTAKGATYKFTITQSGRLGATITAFAAK